MNSYDNEEFFKIIYDGFASKKNLYSSSNFEEDLIEQLKKSAISISVHCKPHNFSKFPLSIFVFGLPIFAILAPIFYI